MGSPGNPDYLNILKNTFDDVPQKDLNPAVQTLKEVLCDDLPQIIESSQAVRLTVCVVPRAKSETVYRSNQLLFKSTVCSVVDQFNNSFINGANYIIRHTDTKTTHLRNTRVRNNNGKDPYPGITKDTCTISEYVNDKDILLIDDIYTPSINIDEDAIQTLLDKGARSVIFYAVGKV